MMTEADAREIVTQEDPEWKMPDDWGELVLIDGSTYNLNKETYDRILDLWYGNYANKQVEMLSDLYGDSAHIRLDAIETMRFVTKLGRAKWVVGVEKRNWRQDDPGQKPEWEG